MMPANKFVLGSVSISKVKTEETRQMWMTTVGELRELMEHRAKLLIWHALIKHENLKTVPLPHRIEDEYGAPPVVVWLEPLPLEKRSPAASRVSHH